MRAHTRDGRGGLGQIPQVTYLIPTVDASANSKKAASRLQQCMNLCACELCPLLPTTQGPLRWVEKICVLLEQEQATSIEKRAPRRNALQHASPLDSSQNWQIKHPALKSGHPDRRLESLFQGTVDVVSLNTCIAFRISYNIFGSQSTLTLPRIIQTLCCVLVLVFVLITPSPTMLPICSWMWSHHR